jgi:hypothetical protein
VSPVRYHRGGVVPVMPFYHASVSGLEINSILTPGNWGTKCLQKGQFTEHNQSGTWLHRELLLEGLRPSSGTVSRFRCVFVFSELESANRYCSLYNGNVNLYEVVPNGYFRLTRHDMAWLEQLSKPVLHATPEYYFLGIKAYWESKETGAGCIWEVMLPCSISILRLVQPSVEPGHAPKS